MTAKKKNPNNYARIRTTAELDVAIRDLHAAREHKGKVVGQDLDMLRNKLRPVSLVSNAFQTVVPYFTWSQLGLGVIRGLKRIVAPTKKKPGLPEKSNPVGQEGPGDASTSEQPDL